MTAHLLSAAVDQLGGIEGGGSGRTGNWILFGPLGLILGAVVGSFLAHITGHDENKWSGRGAIVGALLLMAIFS